MRLYEQLVGCCVGIIAQPVSNAPAWQQVLKEAKVTPMGFDDSRAMLPLSPKSLQSYRLLHEYFAFPEGFMFVNVSGIEKAVKRCQGDELELIFMLNKADELVEKVVSPDNFALFCVPAINLFPKHCDRIHLSNGQFEHHVVPDRTRPMDFEVHSIVDIQGHGSGTQNTQQFYPFYASNDLAAQQPDEAFYTQQRSPRVLSTKQRSYGPRSSYIGSEVSVSLVDAKETPYASELRQLGVYTLCTNRDLPLQIPVGKGVTDFTLEAGAPVKSIRCVAGPTKPKPSWGEGDTTWRLISHLSLNYLSLIDSDEEEGAVALRELLTLYSDIAEPSIRNQISGITRIRSEAVVRRLPLPGPITYGRGVGIEVTFAEAAFEGHGVFLLGAILDQFFSRYVSINSFTQTVIKTQERGEIMRWPLRIGQRHVL
jgi:type VI secretion system protein ImpG